MAITITDILNQWNEMGVFSYVLPFLLIFAIVYAILEKTGMLSSKTGGSDGKGGTVTHNKPILAIVSAAIALLSLQFDYVSIFFAVIFPRFGIGLSIFLVLLILIGFFYPDMGGKVSWIGWLTGIGVAIWALASYDDWYSSGFGGWFSEYIWALLILGGVIALIIVMAKPGRGGSG